MRGNCTGEMRNWVAKAVANVRKSAGMDERQPRIRTSMGPISRAYLGRYPREWLINEDSCHRRPQQDDIKQVSSQGQSMGGLMMDLFVLICFLVSRAPITPVIQRQ